MSPKMTMAMPDAQMKAVLDQLTMLKGKPIPKLSATEARKQPGPTDAVKALLKKQGKSTEPEVVAKVEDKTIESVPVRVYTPSGKGPFPVLVYFHGGGWVIANIDAYDSSARALANAAKCMVVSVGYREAPEYKFPAAPEDSYKVTQWIMKNAKSMNGDPKHIAVGGESAGGNLATVVSMMSRDRKAKMPIYQLLVYPVTDHNFSRPSYIENAMAKPLNKAMMSWFWNNYLKSPADEMNPYASPMKAKSLKGLPPATIIGAEIDPLRSEGMAYSDRLKKAGIAVNYKLYKGVTHEFFGMTAVLDKSKDAIKFAATDLKKAFSK
ncbi:MAG: alpha/beta hydrolase [Candidatus Sericytochromatia bacterium]|nr:alpha/beta hydrolase [Candidatus Sericytochromatia bacterium]